MPKLTFKEKSLYHQIHPLKLFVDWSTGLLMLYLLWFHALIAALLIGIIPSVVASLLIVTYLPLEKYKNSVFGRYVRKYMTKTMEAMRGAGFIVAGGAAWWHLTWLIPLGILIVLFGWFNGWFFPGSNRSSGRRI